MSVYVDDMRAPFGRMIMCHMIADTKAELISFASRIGVNTKWIQKADSYDEHFDVSLTMRSKAVKLGAIEITWRQCGSMIARRREEGILGNPEEAENWLRELNRKEVVL